MTFFEALAAARAEVRNGHALAYWADSGTIILLQTDQGWNPEPFWQGPLPPPRPAGADDSLTD